MITLNFGMMVYRSLQVCVYNMYIVHVNVHVHCTCKCTCTCTCRCGTDCSLRIGELCDCDRLTETCPKGGPSNLLCYGKSPAIMIYMNAFSSPSTHTHIHMYMYMYMYHLHVNSTYKYSMYISRLAANVQCILSLCLCLSSTCIS